jgi:hypothetical protein
LKSHHSLYVPDVSCEISSDVEVAENSNSICNEECGYPLSEKELESDSGNTSDDSIGSQKSQNSCPAVTEDASCSTSFSQDVSVVIAVFIVPLV